MLCTIANLLTSVPAEGGMAALCEDYKSSESGEAEIVIDASRYDQRHWPRLKPELLAYMESAEQFYVRLLDFGGLLLHASCIVLEGRAYLFSGPSRIGKSTHTGLLEQHYGGTIINDDKPALRLLDGQWIAFGTPWSGKSHRNVNASAPVAGICFLTENRSRNEIRPLNSFQALAGVLRQTTYSLFEDRMEILLELTDKLVEAVPFYEMDSLANADSARLIYETMIKAK